MKHILLLITAFMLGSNSMMFGQSQFSIRNWLGDSEFLTMEESAFITSQDMVLSACKQIYADGKYKKGSDRVVSAKELFYSRSFDEVKNAIKKSETTNYGSLWGSLVVVRFGKDLLSFEVANDPPYYKNPLSNIIDISDSEGLYVGETNRYLHIPAIINDSDGYVNVRTDKNSKSKIVGRILDKQIFFVTPTVKSDWYRAYSDKSVYMGYVHKSKILMYKDCPPTIKKKMQHVWGC